MDAVLEKVGIQVFVEAIVKDDGRRTPVDFVGEGNLNPGLQFDLEGIKGEWEVRARYCCTTALTRPHLLNFYAYRTLNSLVRLTSTIWLALYPMSNFLCVQM